jgi:outer membrane protein assembly factor BamB
LVFGAPRGRVVAVDVRTRQTKWTYVPDRQSGLTGEPARLVGANEALLALVPRNVGIELVRLNVIDGAPVWTRPIGGTLPTSVVVNDDSVIYSIRGSVVARSLADGRTVWQRLLPGSWNLLKAGPAVAVYSHYSLSPLWFPTATSLYSWLGWWAGQPVPSAFEVWLFDPKDGQRLQYFTLAARRVPGQVIPAGDRLLVSAGGRVQALRFDSQP